MPRSKHAIKSVPGESQITEVDTDGAEARLSVAGNSKYRTVGIKVDELDDSSFINPLFQQFVLFADQETLDNKIKNGWWNMKVNNSTTIYDAETADECPLESLRDEAEMNIYVLTGNLKMRFRKYNSFKTRDGDEIPAGVTVDLLSCHINIKQRM